MATQFSAATIAPSTVASISLRETDMIRQVGYYLTSQINQMEPRPNQGTWVKLTNLLEHPPLKDIGATLNELYLALRKCTEFEVAGFGEDALVRTNKAFLNGLALTSTSSATVGGGVSIANGSGAANGSGGPRQRNVIVLRDIPSNVPVKEVLDLFSLDETGGPNEEINAANADIGDTWFVTFVSEASAIQAFEGLQSKTFRGQSVKARIKTDHRAVLAATAATEPKKDVDDNGAGGPTSGTSSTQPPALPLFPTYHPSMLGSNPSTTGSVMPASGGGEAPGVPSLPPSATFETLAHTLMAQPMTSQAQATPNSVLMSGPVATQIPFPPLASLPFLIQPPPLSTSMACALPAAHPHPATHLSGYLPVGSSGAAVPVSVSIAPATPSQVRYQPHLQTQSSPPSAFRPFAHPMPLAPYPATPPRFANVEPAMPSTSSAPNPTNMTFAGPSTSSHELFNSPAGLMMMNQMAPMPQGIPIMMTEAPPFAAMDMGAYLQLMLQAAGLGPQFQMTSMPGLAQSLAVGTSNLGAQQLMLQNNLGFLPLPNYPSAFAQQQPQQEQSQPPPFSEQHPQPSHQPEPVVGSGLSLPLGLISDPAIEGFSATTPTHVSGAAVTTQPLAAQPLPNVSILQTPPRLPTTVATTTTTGLSTPMGSAMKPPTPGQTSNRPQNESFVTRASPNRSFVFSPVSDVDVSLGSIFSSGTEMRTPAKTLRSVGTGNDRSTPVVSIWSPTLGDHSTLTSLSRRSSAADSTGSGSAGGGGASVSAISQEEFFDKVIDYVAVVAEDEEGEAGATDSEPGATKINHMPVLCIEEVVVHDIQANEADVRYVVRTVSDGCALATDASTSTSATSEDFGHPHNQPEGSATPEKTAPIPVRRMVYSFDQLIRLKASPALNRPAVCASLLENMDRYGVHPGEHWLSSSFVLQPAVESSQEPVPSAAMTPEINDNLLMMSKVEGPVDLAQLKSQEPQQVNEGTDEAPGGSLASPNSAHNIWNQLTAAIEATAEEVLTDAAEQSENLDRLVPAPVDFLAVGGDEDDRPMSPPSITTVEPEHLFRRGSSDALLPPPPPGTPPNSRMPSCTSSKATTPSPPPQHQQRHERSTAQAPVSKDTPFSSRATTSHEELSVPPSVMPNLLLVPLKAAETQSTPVKSIRMGGEAIVHMKSGGGQLTQQTSFAAPTSSSSSSNTTGFSRPPGQILMPHKDFLMEWYAYFHALHLHHASVTPPQPVSPPMPSSPPTAAAGPAGAPGLLGGPVVNVIVTPARASRPGKSFI